MMCAVGNAPPSDIISRRALFGGAAALLLAGGASAREGRVSLRLMKLRHSMFLLELGDRRALVDPCFSRGLGFGPVLDVAPPALPAERVGRYDLLLVTSGRADQFSARSLKELPGRSAWCLVPDETVARKLRHAGYRRVRVVAGGDRLEVAGLQVEVAPSVDALTGRAAVGYRLARGPRSIFHAGTPPPLDLAADLVRWARQHPTEVALCPWDAWTLADGRRVTMGSLDAQLLAALLRARTVVATCDDARPSLVGGLLATRVPGAPRSELADGPRVVVAEPGVWYRVAAQRRGGPRWRGRLTAR